jgi:hypothetical protein
VNRPGRDVDTFLVGWLVGWTTEVVPSSWKNKKVFFCPLTRGKWHVI